MLEWQLHCPHVNLLNTTTTTTAAAATANNNNNNDEDNNFLLKKKINQDPTSWNLVYTEKWKRFWCKINSSYDTRSNQIPVLHVTYYVDFIA